MSVGICIYYETSKLSQVEMHKNDEYLKTCDTSSGMTSTEANHSMAALNEMHIDAQIMLEEAVAANCTALA